MNSQVREPGSRPRPICISAYLDNGKRDRAYTVQLLEREAHWHLEQQIPSRRRRTRRYPLLLSVRWFFMGTRSFTDWTPHGGLYAHFVLAAPSLISSVQSLRLGALESSSIDITSAQANASPSFPQPWCTTQRVLVDTARFHGS